METQAGQFLSRSRSKRPAAVIERICRFAPIPAVQPSLIVSWKQTSRGESRSIAERYPSRAIARRIVEWAASMASVAAQSVCGSAGLSNAWRAMCPRGRPPRPLSPPSARRRSRSALQTGAPAAARWLLRSFPGGCARGAVSLLHPLRPDDHRKSVGKDRAEPVMGAGDPQFLELRHPSPHLLRSPHGCRRHRSRRAPDPR